MELARLQLYLKLAIEYDTPNGVLVVQYEDRQEAEAEHSSGTESTYNPTSTLKEKNCVNESMSPVVQGC